MQNKFGLLTTFTIKNMTSADCSRYLERINYSGSVNDSIDVLTRLQQLHLLNVPFENLDIHRGKKIELKNNYDKIVIRRRGGFCYELNGVFYDLLAFCDFEAKIVSARVHNTKLQEFGPEFDHMAIIATIRNEKYLVDVGFGEFAYSPLKIEFDLLQPDRSGNFMIRQYEKTHLSVGKIEAGLFTPEYIFTLTSRQLDDFVPMCNYHQTSSLSHFTQKRLCTIVTEKGRTTISENTLKKTENGQVTETDLIDEDGFNRALWDYFKIKL